MCGTTQTGLHTSYSKRKGGSRVHAQMQPNELLVAFLDDVITIARPDRVGLAHQNLAGELWAHCQVRLNSGKTRIRTRATRPRPTRCAGGLLFFFFFGAGGRPVEEQGLTVLGVPVGSAAFVCPQLRQSRAGHDWLLERLPALGDLQASWLLLLFSLSMRRGDGSDPSMYVLRLAGLSPKTSRDLLVFKRSVGMLSSPFCQIRAG